MVLKKCFVCTEEIRNSSTTRFKEDSDFLLCQILELPHLGNDDQKFSEINYCPGCVDRISNIVNMLEELEELERKVLEEKYRIEMQMRINLKNCQNNDSEIPSEKFRAEIVTELRSNSIQSMMDKIRKKEVGRKLSRPKWTRIQKDVTIPRIPKPRNIVDLSDGDLDVNSGHQNSAVIPHLEIMDLRENRFECQSNPTTLPIEDPLNIFTIPTIPSQTTLAPEIDEHDLNMDVKIEEFGEEQSKVLVDLEIEAIPGLDLFAQNHSMGDPVGGNESHHSLETEDSDPFQQIARSEIQGLNMNMKAFICGICEASFDDYEQLKIHDRSHLKKVVRTLSVKSHQARMKLKNPDNSQSPQFKCEECGKVQASKRALRRHIVCLHRDQDKFKCPVCNRGCHQMSALRNHMLIHSEERNYTCQFCPASFKQSASLIVHVQRLHERSRRKYTTLKQSPDN